MNDPNSDSRRGSIMRADPVAQIAADLGQYLWNKGYGRNCVNCDNWKTKEQLCGKFNASPPAEVIVVGCPEHSDMIPF